MEIDQAAKRARQVSRKLAALDADTKNRALREIARALDHNRDAIAAANRNDLQTAQNDRLAAPLVKRLRFDNQKIEEALAGLESLAALPDPVGVTLRAIEIDQGLELYKVSCPIGVIGVIFESRPDALVQISALCLKSGNAVLLKGGREAAATNRALADTIGRAGQNAGLPAGWLHLMETRADVARMLRLDDWIDLIVPRGSNAFVRHIMENTAIAVLGHADGICHVYLDRHADPEMALAIAVDSKCQYVAVCNAAETMLVHRRMAPALLPELKAALEKQDVEIRGCDQTRKIIDVKPAIDEDWATEYLDRIVAVRVVDTLAAAVDHINRYGSGHTDAIVTEDRERGLRFMAEVDSADVFLNCSTRFSDGFRYGLGAEVGISTNKIHARGPVGLEGLTIYKWKMIGSGHRVADYSGPGARTFTHRLMDDKFPG